MYFLILSSKISCVGRSFEFFVRGKILFFSMEISTCCREEGFNKRFQRIPSFFYIYNNLGGEKDGNIILCPS